jgi:hypothetical protein
MLHVLPLSADADGVFTLSDRTEARLRAPDPITNAAALDLDTLVDARAVWSPRNATYTLADLPRFTLLDYNGAGRQGAVLDSAIASADWRLSPRVRIRLSENASYGELSLESLTAIPAPGTPVATTPPGQPQPGLTAAQGPLTSAPILYGASDTSLASTLELRRWTVLPRVGYQLTGGVNDSAQQILPFQQGPYADITADDKVDAHNHLATIVNGSDTAFSTGTEDLLASAEEHWRHAWSSRTETMLGAGWYLARTRAGFGDPDVFASNPIAEGSVEHTFRVAGGAGYTRLDLRLAPFINRLTGLVDEQVRASAEGSWTRRRFKLRAFASFGESTVQGTSTSARLGTAEIDAAYKFNQYLTLDGGVRALYQEQDSLGNVPAAGGPAPIVENTLSQGVVFIAVTVSAPRVRF